MRLLSLAIGTVVAVALAGAAFAQQPPSYTIEDIGSLAGDDFGTVPAPRGLSASGQVIGFTDYFTTNSQTGESIRSTTDFIWQGGAMTALPPAYTGRSDVNGATPLTGYMTHGISGAGLVVGEAGDPEIPGFSNLVGFLHNLRTGVSTVFRPDPGVTSRTEGSTTAAAVSDTGLVTGFQGNGAGRRGYVYDSVAGTWTFFAALPPEQSAFGVQNFPAGINDAGWVVGRTQNIEGRERAFVRRPDNTVAVIEPPVDWQATVGNAINEQNTAVGRFYRGTALPRSGAFRWSEETGFVDLFAGQILPENYDGGDALDINDAGQIVGTMVLDVGVPESVGVIWHEGVVHDLNALIPEADRGGYRIMSAVAINNNGWIVAFGERFGFGGDCGGTLPGSCARTFLLRPVAVEPGCPADFDGSNGVQVADIFAFLRAWFAQDPRADFDGQSGIQVADIFAFLRAWFAGCP